MKEKEEEEMKSVEIRCRRVWIQQIGYKSKTDKGSQKETRKERACEKKIEVK